MPYTKISMKKPTKKPVAVLLTLLMVSILCILSACSPEQSSLPTTNASASSEERDITGARTAANAKLSEFEATITTLKNWNGDAQSFETELTKQKTAFGTAKTPEDYQNISTEVDKQLEEMKLPLAQAEAYAAVDKYLEDVSAWRDKNTYTNPYDGQTYRLGGEFGLESGDYGAASNIYAEKYIADENGTIEGYNYLTKFTNDLYTNFDAMTRNFKDKTPWDKAHDTDKELLEYYGNTSGYAIILSMNEQTVRVYLDGELVHAIPVVTGRPERPTPAGYYEIDVIKSPAKFTSMDDPSSPFYYEPLDLQYALRFTIWEHNFHDAPWRSVFGNGDGYRANFPHADMGPDSTNGSHGCVNMTADNAAWMYNTIPYGTPVIAY